MTIDAGAVSAFQVGEDQIVPILLDLGMIPADALIIQPQEVTFFASNRKWHSKVAENSTLIDAIHGLKGHFQDGAGRRPRCFHIHSFPRRIGHVILDFDGLTRSLSSPKKQKSIRLRGAGTRGDAETTSLAVWQSYGCASGSARPFRRGSNRPLGRRKL